MKPKTKAAVRRGRKSATRRLDLTKPVERPRMPFAVMARMFLLGSVAVGASSYAIYRHYYVPRPSMLMPAAPAGTSPVTSAPDFIDVSPDLVPAPALVPDPAPASAPAPPSAPAPASAAAPAPAR